MNKKQCFIDEIESLLKSYNVQLSADSNSYFQILKNQPEKERILITENGQKILNFMKQNMEQYNNIFKARDIGEGLFISSRSVSGSMQKLIKEGFCEKIIGNPVCYSITNNGMQQALD